MAALVMTALVPLVAHASDPADCEDFASSGDAQGYYERFPGDPADLDRDGDGYACDYGPPDPSDDERYDSPGNNEERGSTSFNWGGVVGYGLLIGVAALLFWSWIDDRPHRRTLAQAERAGTYVKARGPIWTCQNGEPVQMGDLVAWEYDGHRWLGLVETADGPSRRRQDYFPQEDLQFPD